MTVCVRLTVVIVASVACWQVLPEQAQSAETSRGDLTRVPPPSFGDCKFTFDDEEQTVEIELNYL